MKRSKLANVSDVVEIPLPDGTYAAGRLYNDASIGIFDARFSSPISINQVEKLPTAFVTACLDSAIDDGTWRVIGKIPFENSEEEWAPPRYIEDIVEPGNYDIYYKGKIRPATKDEIIGLEPAIMLTADGLIERIRKEIPTTKR